MTTPAVGIASRPLRGALAALGELVDRLSPASNDPLPPPAPASITIYSSKAPRRERRTAG